jgi:GT2 family glycosyltransferase
MSRFKPRLPSNETNIEPPPVLPMRHVGPSAAKRRNREPAVAVTIVTYNSARYIEQCLKYVFEQDYPRLQVVVVDNASVDGSREILKGFEDRLRIIWNAENRGFAAAQNQALAVCEADWVLTLNPDVRLTPDFISRLVEAGEAELPIGSVCGKLLAMGPDFIVPSRPVFDSTGIYMTPNLRHFDRGNREPDNGQYDHPEYVFGGTGAACLYRREMVEDLAIDGEFFDSDFFAYREDADVAWRAQLLGWKCLYTPRAIAYHVRTVVPSNRNSLPAAINMHSVKNRWLLRIKNVTRDLYLRHWAAITGRDIVVIGACLVREFQSLRAFPLVARYWRGAWQKRKHTMERRRTSDEVMASWFHESPAAIPAEERRPETVGMGRTAKR